MQLSGLESQLAEFESQFPEFESQLFGFVSRHLQKIQYGRQKKHSLAGKKIYTKKLLIDRIRRFSLQYNINNIIVVKIGNVPTATSVKRMILF
jgi:hypothetical protein